jgi:hypothetical protein
MKQITILSFLVMLSAACKKDNYEAPSAVLKGRIVYNKQPLGLRSNGVQLELWQRGFELFTKIPVYVAQDGSFSVSLFNGQYKLVRLPGNGPWVNNTDSIDITVSGSAEIEVPVEPYWIIANQSIQQNGNRITATFSLQRVSSRLPLESVGLFLGQTLITDQVNNQSTTLKDAADIADVTQPVTLTADIPASLAAKGQLHARVGVKTSGVAEWLYGEPVKFQLK